MQPGINIHPAVSITLHYIKYLLLWHEYITEIWNWYKLTRYAVLLHDCSVAERHVMMWNYPAVNLNWGMCITISMHHHQDHGHWSHCTIKPHCMPLITAETLQDMPIVANCPSRDASPSLHLCQLMLCSRSEHCTYCLTVHLSCGRAAHSVCVCKNICWLLTRVCHQLSQESPYPDMPCLIFVIWDAAIHSCTKLCPIVQDHFFSCGIVLYS